LMGADNLRNISYWKSWKNIFNKMPIAIFDRAGNQLSTTHSKAAIYFKRYRISPNFSSALPGLKPPAWCFIHMKRLNISSTSIRAKKPNN
ncbi:MAG: nicotinic acid mononucleotide adenylyltransferase, partial [Rhizobiales bacterium]|nr:nicotinic acid mononucleotide adenylyltransferase [Hyphomicrobiales bacterium]